MGLIFAASLSFSSLGLLLAAAGDVPTWVGIPAGIAGLGIPLGLWLTGRVTLTSDAELRFRQYEDRISALVADRAAWREAHAAEVQARVAAERAAAALLDQSKTTVELLSLLNSALSRGTK